jgi:hypothetical protein
MLLIIVATSYVRFPGICTNMERCGCLLILTSLLCLLALLLLLLFLTLILADGNSLLTLRVGLHRILASINRISVEDKV